MLLIWQFFLIPNGFNEFVDHRHLLLELVLPQFDHHLEIYTYQL
jgi:hypothetical protein